MFLYLYGYFNFIFFMIVMHVKRHEQFEIGCVAILNNIYCIIFGRVIDHLSDICESGA